MALGQSIKSVTSKVSKWVTDTFGTDPDEVPTDSKKPEEIADYVTALYKDSLMWRKKSLMKRISNFDDPVTFWRECRKLEAGDHWSVWGHRNQISGNEWMHELVDDEVASQIRVRKSHMTANFHDVTISPNVKDINTIFNQERKNTYWGKNIIKALHKCLVEGTAIFKSVMDYSTNPNGTATEIICDNASIFPTPFATSFQEIDGCWYTIYGTMQTRQHIRAMIANDTYDELDMNKVNAAGAERMRDLSLTVGYEDTNNYQHTQLIDVLECWMDDDTLETVPYAPEETSTEHDAIQEGINPPVYDDQNHKQHIKAHNEFLDTLGQAVDEKSTPEEIKLTSALSSMTMEHITDHMKAEKKTGGLKGKQKKYPFGRKITVVSGVLAADIPNDHKMDWRRLFHKFDCETVPESFWGRGMAEVLWNTNKTEDTMLSRIADTAITTSMPAPWLSIDDKQHVEKEKYTNDPTKFKYYNKMPPVFPTGNAPRENMEIYNTMKQIGQKQQGVGDVSYGKAPSSQPSGDLVNALIQQNLVLITGEANVNLNDAIESIVETRLQMWKNFYTEPRWYFISGQMQALTLSDVLRFYDVTDTKTGQMTQKEVPEFQISVKPNSNFPNQWELDFNFLFHLATTPMPNGTALVPTKALYNLLAQRYPEFAPNGSWSQASEAEQIGNQVIQQKQLKAKQEEKDLNLIATQYKQSAIGKIIQGKPIVPVDQQSPNGAQ